MSTENIAGYCLDRLVTISSLAERIRVPLGTIRDWIHMEYIPCVKLGRRIYFDVDVVNGWINGKARPRKAATALSRRSGVLC